MGQVIDKPYWQRDKLTGKFVKIIPQPKEYKHLENFHKKHDNKLGPARVKRVDQPPLF